MKTEDEKTPLLLLEGEVLLKNSGEIAKAELKVSILDITHIDAKSHVLAESVEMLLVKQDQTTIPFEIFGPEPDPLRNYIVVAVISTNDEIRGKRTLYRTTQSIPVFKDGYPGFIKVPLSRME